MKVLVENGVLLIVALLAVDLSYDFLIPQVSGSIFGLVLWLTYELGKYRAKHE